MEQINIDQQLCNGCGLCCDICPHRLLVSSANGIEVGSGACMLCGHCQAVCPTGAIRVSGRTTSLDMVHIPESEDAVMPGKFDCGELVQLLRSRRSCRSYSDLPVDLTLLEDLVKVGTTAPSGTNSQAWNFIILPTRADVKVLGGITADYYRQLNSQARNPFYRLIAKIAAGDALGKYYRNYYDSVSLALQEWDEQQVDRLFHGATAAILVTGKREASCPAEDALLATQNILLTAHALGLGSCLIGFTVEAMRRRQRLRQLMAIPDDEEIYSVIALGYPAVKFRHVAVRKTVQPRVLHLTREEEMVD